MTRRWMNSLLLPLAILLVYFLVPINADDAPIGVAAGLGVAALGLIGVGAVIFNEARRAQKRLRLIHLVLALELVLVLFSAAYYLLALNDPGQFNGMTTRLDALYFSTTTVATVGYGDIHAVGQFGRAMVTMQLVFNLLFIAALVGLVQDRLRHGSGGPGSAVGWQRHKAGHGHGGGHHHRHDHGQRGGEQAADFWEARYAGSDRVWSGRPNAAVVSVVTGLPVGDALDLGCGEGADAIWLAGQGWRVTAVDVSPTAIERGRQAAEAQGLTAIDWVVADLETWQPDAGYDLVTASFLHSPVALSRDQVLRRAAGRVRSGGHLLLVSHAAPPPWASQLQHGHHDFPGPEEQLGRLDLGPEWLTVLAEVRHREATGPDGKPASLEDTVVLLRRH